MPASALLPDVKKEVVPDRAVFPDVKKEVVTDSLFLLDGQKEIVLTPGTAWKPSRGSGSTRQQMPQRKKR